MRKLLPFFLLLIGLPALAGDFHPEANAELAQNNIWLEVNFRGGNAIVANFRALFDKPADKVFPVLIDTNAMPRVHGNYEDAAALTKETFDAIVAANPQDVDTLESLIKKIPSESGRNKGGHWTRYEYLNLNFPWPLSNRWTVQMAQVDESDAASGRYRYDYKMYVGNFKALSGYWELVPVAGKPGWTEFRGSYLSDAGIALPKFVTKTAAKTGLKRDVEDNRRVLGSK